MKKTLIAILALILCLSFALSGCVAENTEQKGTDANGAPNGDPTEAATEGEKADPTDKELLKDLITLEGLEGLEGLQDALFPFIDFDGALSESIVELISSLALKGELTVSFGGIENKAEAAVKDNQFYCALYENAEITEAYYATLTGTLFETFALLDGYWTKGQTFDIGEYLDSLGGMTGSFPGINLEDLAAGDVTIPELEDEYITEKDGMLVIDTDYFIELFFANIGLVAGNEMMPAEEIESTKAAVKEVADKLGIEIAVAMGAQTISKISVTLNPTDETLPITSASLVASATPDGKNLEYVEAKLVVPYNELGMDVDMTYGVRFDAVSENGAVVGYKLNAEISVPAMLTYDPGMPESGETKIPYEAVFASQKITVSANLDLSKLASVGENLADLKFSMFVDKAYKIEGENDYMTGESTTKSITEINAAEFEQERIDLSASVKFADKETILLEAYVNVRGETISIKGKLTFGEFDFPVSSEDILG